MLQERKEREVAQGKRREDGDRAWIINEVRKLAKEQTAFNSLLKEMKGERTMSSRLMACARRRDSGALREELDQLQKVVVRPSFPQNVYPPSSRRPKIQLVGTELAYIIES